MSSGKVWLGVLAGVAAGVVFGMLFAPRKGSATRKRIARKGTDYADDIKETFNDSIDSLADEYDTVKESARGWVEKGKEKAASLVGTKRSR